MAMPERVAFPNSPGDAIASCRRKSDRGRESVPTPVVLSHNRCKNPIDTPEAGMARLLMGLRLPSFKKFQVITRRCVITDRGMSVAACQPRQRRAGYKDLKRKVRQPLGCRAYG